jgi:hypothetical protein
VYQATFSSDGQKAGIFARFLWRFLCFRIDMERDLFLKNMGIYYYDV